MALYESYLDEDINDESLSESYDLGEDYDEAGEDYDEGAEDYDEASPWRRLRRLRRRNKKRGGKSRRMTAAPVTSGSVKRAFSNVSDDVSILRRKARLSDNARATSLGVDIVSAALLAPKLEKDANGEFVIKNNLLPLIGVKLIGNMIGGGQSLDFRKVLPWILAALLLSPDSLKQLGVDVNGGTGTSNTSNRLFGNLDTTTLLLLGGLIYFAAAKK